MTFHPLTVSRYRGKSALSSLNWACVSSHPRLQSDPSKTGLARAKPSPLCLNAPDHLPFNRTMAVAFQRHATHHNAAEATPIFGPGNKTTHRMQRPSPLSAGPEDGAMVRVHKPRDEPAGGPQASAATDSQRPPDLGPPGLVRGRAGAALRRQPPRRDGPRNPHTSPGTPDWPWLPC